MAQREVENWITINGKHIPIFKGESKQDAYNRAVAKDNEDKKNADISKRQKEIDKLNGYKKGSIESIQEQLKSSNPDYNKIAEEINDNVQTAGYFMHYGDNGITIYGKNHNDNFQTISPVGDEKVGPGRFGMDSIDMAKVLKDKADGNWALHKYDGQIKFPATLINKKAPAKADFNAIIISKMPTSADYEKITTQNGYDIYRIKNTNPSKMFEYVALKK